MCRNSYNASLLWAGRSLLHCLEQLAFCREDITDTLTESTLIHRSVWAEKRGREGGREGGERERGREGGRERGEREGERERGREGRERERGRGEREGGERGQTVQIKQLFSISFPVVLQVYYFFIRS